MPTYTIGQAKTQLSKPVHEAEAGEEVVTRDPAFAAYAVPTTW